MTTLETTAVPADIRSPEEINALLGRKSGVWRVIRAIRSNRPFLTAVLVVLAPVHALVTHAPVYDLVGSDRSWRFFLPWTLILLGVAIRLWGSGNLHKNQEITSTGAYRLVRHPLYVGSLAFFLAYFLTTTDPRVGLVLFAVLVGFVYYPTMLSEEEYLIAKFPAVAAGRAFPWRLIPDPRRLPEAISTDCFTVQTAWNNLGFRSAWFILGLPLFLRVLQWVQGMFW